MLLDRELECLNTDEILILPWAFHGGSKAAVVG